MSIIRRSYLLGGAFDPRDLSQLVSMYDVDDAATRYSDLAGTTPAASGDVLGYLDDLHGDYPLIAPSSPARPALATAGGHVYAAFDGLAHALTTSDYAAVLSVPTVIILTRVRSGSSRFWTGSTSGTASERTIMYSSGTNVQRVWSDGVFFRPLWSDNVWTQIGVRRLDAGGGTAIEDGTIITGTLGSGGLAGLVVAAANGISNFGEMDLLSALVFDGEISDDEIAQIWAWAQERYGGVL